MEKNKVPQDEGITAGITREVQYAIDENGNPLGLHQITFDSLKNGIFYFRHAPLEGGDPVHAIVRKNSKYRYVWFSLATNDTIPAEPAMDQWDLLFTQYTTMLYTDAGEPYPYLLTGVLSNPSGVQIAQDTLYDFSALDLDAAGSLIYSEAYDEIGYDWKDVVGDVSTGMVTYVIVEGLNYVVRDAEGFYYKLRFIGFYNNSGSKGYPTFEYQKL